MLQRPPGPASRPGTTLLRVCPLLAAAALAACGPGPLAEAGGSRLTVEAAARLIAAHSSVPADSQVVRVVAELWVDYTLLANRLEEDPTLASLDVGVATEQPLNEIMLGRLRDEAVPVDTVVTDEELTARFATEMPGARATASQILLLFPGSATLRQRDSVRVVAEGLHARLAAGADFATLAARHSGDPGSGSRGGSMGTFERGQMLPPVDEAVFSLQPGRLGEPVETALGYHLLRLDALEVPQLAEVGDEFRRRIQQERIARAEAGYVSRLDSASGLGLAGNALAIVRALASTTPSGLSPGAARRELVTWNDGAYLAGDFVRILANAPEGFAEEVANAPDDELEAALRQLGQEQLILHEARALGLAPTEAETDSVANEARAVILRWAEGIGLIRGGGEEAEGSAAGTETEDSAAAAMETPAAGAALTPTPPLPATPAERVEAALIRVISGEQEIVPLGGVTFLLREQGSWRIRESRVGATLTRIAEVLSGNMNP